MNEDILWTEKYRPKTIQNTILPQKLKKVFQRYVDKKEVPNLILGGGSGMGKTTVARAMLEELGCEYILINGSLENGIETLRTKISRFAGSVSFRGGRKYIILDEADYLTHAMQPALRNFMEEFSSNCGFILTCNYKNKIIPALHSRCSYIDFNIPKDEKSTLAKEFVIALTKILDSENIEYDTKVLVEVIKKYFPDWRRVLNEIQAYSVTGKIDTGMLVNIRDISLTELLDHMKKSDFTSARKWVAQNSDIDSTTFYQEFYDKAALIAEKKDIPYLVLLISKYSYQDVQALSKEINTAAFLVEVMVNVKLKELT